MIFRNFRVIATGQWLNVLLTTEGDSFSFSVSARTHREQIALGFGLPIGDIEVLDGPADQRRGILVPAPVPPPNPDPDYAAWIAGTAAQKLEITRRRLGINPG